ncbi:hypothetical protein P692DRAFT_20881483 [Suillus brevipes Sb2]|nr:hypothetical protein P692DRAFT_20881483 [Suillus brevipes Sb2]
MTHRHHYAVHHDDEYIPPAVPRRHLLLECTVRTPLKMHVISAVVLPAFPPSRPPSFPPTCLPAHALHRLAYIDILERLNAAIAFKSSDADSRDMVRQIETGAKKLTQLYTKLVTEGSSGSLPVSGLAFMLTEFPPPLMSSLTPLVVFLRTLPLPSTHPSLSAVPLS